MYIYIYIYIPLSPHTGVGRVFVFILNTFPLCVYYWCRVLCVFCNTKINILIQGIGNSLKFSTHSRVFVRVSLKDLLCSIDRSIDRYLPGGGGEDGFLLDKEGIIPFKTRGRKKNIRVCARIRSVDQHHHEEGSKMSSRKKATTKAFPPPANRR